MQAREEDEPAEGSGPKSTRPPGEFRLVFACLAAQVAMGFGAYTFPIFLKPVTEDLGWSRTAYSLAQPILATSVALVGPLVGRISDTRPRRVLLIGGLLMSAALLGAGAMQEVWQFYAVAAVGGIAVACLGDLPTAAAITARFREHRGAALSTVYIGSNLGGAVGPALAVAVAGWAGWRAGFLSIGSIAWMLVIPVWFFVRDKRGSADDAEARETSAPAEADATTHPDTGAGGIPPPKTAPPAEAAPHDASEAADAAVDVDVAAAVRSRDFWLIFWAIFIFYLYRLGVNTQLVAYLGDEGYSTELATASYSLMVGIGIAGKLFAGQIGDRLGARPAVIGNFVLMAAASFLVLAPGLPGAIPTFLVLHGATTAAEDVVMPLLIARRFGGTHLAAIYGMALLALVPGAALGPVAAGWTYDLLGSYERIFLGFALLNLTSVAALLLVRTRRPGDH